MIKQSRRATNNYGVLAQLGEHLPYKQRVIGSSPIGPIYICGEIAQLARACGSYPQCRGFESPSRYGGTLRRNPERFIFMTIEWSQSVHSIVLPVHKQKELRQWRGERSGNHVGERMRWTEPCHKKQQNKNLKITVDKFCIVLYTNKVGCRWCTCSRNYGVLAQLGEHLPYKQRVIGSSPIGPISILWRDSSVG